MVCCLFLFLFYNHSHMCKRSTLFFSCTCIYIHSTLVFFYTCAQKKSDQQNKLLIDKYIKICLIISIKAFELVISMFYQRKMVYLKHFPKPVQIGRSGYLNRFGYNSSSMDRVLWKTYHFQLYIKRLILYTIETCSQKFTTRWEEPTSKK